jgi:AcrR family transcriptional regulator
MKRARKPRAPQQARSRDTERRLLDAAEAVLVKYGAEGTTLPRIAREAGVAPATVYRRFRDKEALMAAVFRRFAERSSAGTREAFNPESVRSLGLTQFATNVVQNMVRGFRASAPLTRAAMRYAELNPRLEAVRETGDSEARSFQQMVDTFRMWRDEIHRPDPEQAIRFAFLVVASMLRDLITFDRMRLMQRVVAVDDELLARELPRVFLSCLRS